MPDEKNGDSENIDGLTREELQKYINDCWKKEFRPFYNPQDFVLPISESEGKKAENEIVKEIRMGIANLRTSRNVLMKWKPLVFARCVT